MEGSLHWIVRRESCMLGYKLRSFSLPLLGVIPLASNIDDDDYDRRPRGLLLSKGCTCREGFTDLEPIADDVATNNDPPRCRFCGKPLGINDGEGRYREKYDE